MGLSVALDSALSGLRLTQTGLETVSRNVANAGLEGYTKRSVSGAERQGVGVRDAEVRRALDTIVQRQLRTESGGGTYSSTMASFLQRLDEAFGPPGGTGALDTSYNGLTSALQTLSAEPGNTVARRAVLDAARGLSASLNRLSGDIQELRGDAESRISGAVGEANAALKTIETVSAKLNSSVTGNARAELLDERDRQIDRLSSLMDIRMSDDGAQGLSIFTSGGVALYSGKASQLAFDQRGIAGATARFDVDPAKSGVGQLRIVNPFGSAVDVTQGGLRSGELAALLTLRDQDLVAAQDRLDGVAAGVAQALSDSAVAGTAVTSGAQAGFDLDLAGLQAGNVVTLDVLEQPGATPRRYALIRVDNPATLPLPQSATADPNDRVIGIDFSGGIGPAAASLQAALGPGFSVSASGGQVLRILDDGAAGTTDIAGLSAAITNTALSGQGAELPLFVDAASSAGARAFTGSFEGGAQLRGFAARIGLNPALANDPARLVVSSSTTPAGDPARPALMLERLMQGVRTFPGEAGGAFQGTPGTYLRQVLDTQASHAADAAQVDDGQKIVVASLKERFSQVSGVSIDQEMAELVSLQNAYSANARIVSAVRDMLDTLMRI